MMRSHPGAGNSRATHADNLSFEILVGDVCP